MLPLCGIPTVDNDYVNLIPLPTGCVLRRCQLPTAPTAWLLPLDEVRGNTRNTRISRNTSSLLLFFGVTQQEF